MKTSDTAIEVPGKAFSSGVTELVVELVLSLHSKHRTYPTCVNERHSNISNEGQKCSVDMESGQFTKGTVTAGMAVH